MSQRMLEVRRKRGINPVLYVALSGDVTWDRWCAARTKVPDLDQIEDLAFQVYPELPYPDAKRPGHVRRSLEAALASAAMVALIEQLKQLPSDLFPACRITPKFAVGFVLKLVPQLAKAS